MTDKSGRGYKAMMSKNQLMGMYDDTTWYDVDSEEEFIDWLDRAEVNETLHGTGMEVTRVK